MKKLPLVALLLGSAATTACGSDIQIEGTYDTTAVWDISEPFGRGGIGGAIAELIITESISLAAPGFIEGAAIDVATPLLKPPIQLAIDSQLPDDLKEDGEVIVGLREALGAVEVETELVFTDDVEGTEKLTMLAIPGENRFEWRDDLLPSDVKIAAEIEGDREEEDRVELDDYVLQVHYGEFVLAVTAHLFGKNASSLEVTIENAVPCQAIVDEVTGGDGSVDFSVAGQNVSISAGALTSACELVRDTVGQFALGAARLDSGVELGGKVTLIDDDDDGVADRLSSDAEFEGKITVLPAFEPKFSANWVGERR
ncbi:MAG: hypothetical protein RIT81_07740 [Deltaproteobacteria bacterium]